MATGGSLTRRRLIGTGVASAGVLALGPSFWRQAFAAAPAKPGAGPYGALRAADANGLMLPAGFRSRLIARGLLPVQNAGYPWHIFSDGQATYATEDNGWILVSNSEVPLPGGGGASAIRFNDQGQIKGAYRILSGTQTNCAGGRTPWGTWLSCEEHEQGTVWECDPFGRKQAVERPAMGVFQHEAVCADPVGKRLYLTEDLGDAGFYRFTPKSYPDLSEGTLEIAVVGGAGGPVTWKQVPDPLATRTPTRKQVPGAAKFARGEGIWFDSDIVYMTTTSDNKVWAYDTVAEQLEVLYDARTLSDPPLRGVDNVTVAEQSGDVFVAEDGDDLDICMITPDREVARFLKLTGLEHEESELTGVVFDPSGSRMYFSSQRALGTGAIYEVSGPFRQGRPLKLDLTLAPKQSLGSLRRRGLKADVRVSSPAKVELRVETKVAPRRSARSGAARKRLTISKRSRVVGQVKQVRMRPRRAAVERLRDKRSVSIRVVASARDFAGRSAKIERRLRLR